MNQLDITTNIDKNVSVLKTHYLELQNVSSDKSILTTVTSYTIGLKQQIDDIVKWLNEGLKIRKEQDRLFQLERTLTYSENAIYQIEFLRKTNRWY